MKKQTKPGDMFNAFQAKKKKKSVPMPKAVKSGASKPFVPMYGGKAGGKMSNGAGWGGEKMKKGGKKGGKKSKKGSKKMKEGLKFGSAEWRAKYMGKKKAKKMSGKMSGKCKTKHKHSKKCMM